VTLPGPGRGGARPDGRTANVPGGDVPSRGSVKARCRAGPGPTERAKAASRGWAGLQQAGPYPEGRAGYRARRPGRKKRTTTSSRVACNRGANWRRKSLSCPSGEGTDQLGGEPPAALRPSTAPEDGTEPADERHGQVLDGGEERELVGAAGLDERPQQHPGPPEAIAA